MCIGRRGAIQTRNKSSTSRRHLLCDRHGRIIDMMYDEEGGETNSDQGLNCTQGSGHDLHETTPPPVPRQLMSGTGKGREPLIDNGRWRSPRAKPPTVSLPERMVQKQLFSSYVGTGGTY